MKSPSVKEQDPVAPPWRGMANGSSAVDHQWAAVDAEVKREVDQQMAAIDAEWSDAMRKAFLVVGALILSGIAITLFVRFVYTMNPRSCVEVCGARGVAVCRAYSVECVVKQ